MFCVQCGAKNEDRSRFCQQCGAVLNTQSEPEVTPVPVEQEAPVTPMSKPKRGKKKLWVGLGAAGIAGIVGISAAAVTAVVTLVLVLILIFSGNSPKSVVKDYMKATLKPDMATFLELLPKDVIEKEFASNREERQWVESKNKTLQEYHEYLDEQYDDWDLTYKIIHVDNVNKGYLSDLKDYYLDTYDCKVKAAKEITVEITFKHDGRETTEEFYFHVIKVGGKWYLELRENMLPSTLLWRFMF